MRGGCWLGLAVAVGACLPACTPVIPAEPPPANAPVPDHARDDPAPSEPGPIAEIVDGPAPTTPALVLPARFTALGRSCGEVDDQVSALCDTEGMAVGLAAPVDLVHDIPWDHIEVIHDETGRVRGGELEVGFVGPTQLWVRHVSCGICRRVIGVALVAELDRLSDEQRQRVQDEAGLPTEPVLRTREDWQRALAPQ